VVLVVNALLIALMGDEYRFAVGIGAAAVLCELFEALLARQGVTMRTRVVVRAGALALLSAAGYYAVIAVTGVLVWPVAVCAGLCVLSAGVAAATQAVLER
jgi:hypothetical protein